MSQEVTSWFELARHLGLHWQPPQWAQPFREPHPDRMTGRRTGVDVEIHWPAGGVTRHTVVLGIISPPLPLGLSIVSKKRVIHARTHPGARPVPGLGFRFGRRFAVRALDVVHAEALLDAEFRQHLLSICRRMRTTWSFSVRDEQVQIAIGSDVTAVRELDDALTIVSDFAERLRTRARLLAFRSTGAYR